MQSESLLNTIEREFKSGHYHSVCERLDSLALPVLLQWESQSQIIRDALQRFGHWEKRFASSDPLTYERLKQSAGRRSNASALMPGKNVWRDLLLLLRSERTQSIWQAGKDAQVAVGVADEFGIDRIHMVVHGTLPTIRVLELGRDPISFPLPSAALWNPQGAMQVAKLWTIPFQDAVLVLLQSKVDRKLHELVWVRSNDSDKANRDLSMWAVNHNNLNENPAEFLAPPFLQGDPTLTPHVLLAATEGRVDIKGATVAATSITIRKRDTMLFDQAKIAAPLDAPPKHWRQLLSAELWEPHADITATCYVLDAFLLYACSDGILRAHPRGNPQSTYHVEDIQSKVYQMTSLYNVIAIIHSVDVLEVRSVARKTEDPFVHFPLIVFRATMVDPNHAPLLYGPYVIYRSTLEGTWMQARHGSKPTPIKVPFRAGWQIVNIKAANWRYWVVTLRNPRVKSLEDYFLFAGDESPAFLKARCCCIDCGAAATHMCGGCLGVGFCLEHGMESEHRSNCSK